MLSRNTNAIEFLTLLPSPDFNRFVSFVLIKTSWDLIVHVREWYVQEHEMHERCHKSSARNKFEILNVIR